MTGGHDLVRCGWGLEDNSSEAPVPVQEDSSITGKINLDS